MNLELEMKEASSYEKKLGIMLQDLCSKDGQFKAILEQSTVSLKNTFGYLTSEARKKAQNGAYCMTPEDALEYAREYIEKDGKDLKTEIITERQKVAEKALTEEEKAKIEAQAKEEYKQKIMAELKAKEEKERKKLEEAERKRKEREKQLEEELKALELERKQKASGEQMSLFDEF